MNDGTVVETSRVELLSMPPVWVIVLVLLPAVLLLCRWLYRAEPSEGGWRWWPALLRAAVVGFVLLLLFEPVRLHQRVRVERPLAVFLVDDSASMRERDMPRVAERADLPPEASRRRVVQALLERPLENLRERYEVSLYAFGETLRAIGSLDDLEAADGGTRLGDALAGLAAETRGRPVAQTVVVTDGRSNAGRDVQAALGALVSRRIPVNALGVGDPRVPRDVRIAAVTVPEVALAGDTVSLEVAVASRGYPGELVTLLLRDGETDAQLARDDVRLPDAEGLTEQTYRLAFVPEREGDLDLRLEVVPRPGERDVVNNVERRMIRVEPGHVRVLYVEGYPRYEYRFLKDSLLRVANLEVQMLLLSADPDFIQESSRGLPALTRFPPTLEDLLEYHVIIFGDVHPQDLGEDSDRLLANVKSFVEAGGGFLMQAGPYNAPREYATTPIADILPVILGDPQLEWANVYEPDQPFRPRLARPRDPHEIVTLLPDVERNQQLWEEEGGLAPLTWYWPVAKARTTAEVLLTHPVSRNVHGPHVILATAFYPRGRTAFLATDETWRWRFRYMETYREPFWRSLIRYLALNRLRRSDYRFDLSTDRSTYDIGERVVVTARIRESGIDPLVADEQDVVLVQPDGRRRSLALPRERDGVFTGSFAALQEGPYRLWIEDPAAPGEPRSPRVVTARRPSVEQDDPVLDEALLQSVAASTGGRYFRVDQTVQLLADFNDPPRERPLDEPEREELWSGWPPLLALTALLAGEWILRKRRNLV